MTKREALLKALRSAVAAAPEAEMRVLYLALYDYERTYPRTVLIKSPLLRSIFETLHEGLIDVEMELNCGGPPYCGVCELCRNAEAISEREAGC